MAVLLIAEDEKDMQNIIVDFMQQGGHSCILANDGVEALSILENNTVDLIILDIMMPRLDGFTVCKFARNICDVPIIFLTAKGEENDKLKGYEYGADDYVTKPFEAKEVMARIKAVLRRSKGDSEAASDDKKTVVYDKLEINIVNYELKVNGEAIDTPPKELELIYHFASNPNRVYTRDQLLDEVWGFDYYGDSRTVDVHVKRLREKLEGVSDKWTLKTVWGVGYKFETKE